MADVRADLQTALETVIGALPIVAGVFDDMPDSDPPKGKVLIEVGFDSEKAAEITGAQRGPSVTDFAVLADVWIKGAVPRDWSKATFEGDVGGMIKAAVCGSPDILALCDTIAPAGAEWVRAQDQSTPFTLKRQIFRITFTTPNDAPGRRI